jgi:hypothetical protein
MNDVNAERVDSFPPNDRLALLEIVGWLEEETKKKRNEQSTAEMLLMVVDAVASLL